MHTLTLRRLQTAHPALRLAGNIGYLLLVSSGIVTSEHQYTSPPRLFSPFEAAVSSKLPSNAEFILVPYILSRASLPTEAITIVQQMHQG